jgi:sugar lactone lactonase YvrE
MTRCLTYTVLALLLGAASAFAQAKATAQNVPEIPYDSVPNFIKMPAGLYLGEAIGVSTNSKGHVFVYTRSANTRLFEFDQNGVFVREIGEGAYNFEFAHSVRVDKDDNIWVVDEGTNTVTRFNPEGHITMVIGRRPPAVQGMLISPPQGPTPPAAKYTFGRPTDVAWDPQGNIFVSDGYVNHRVVKFDKNGRFVKQVGSERPGNEPSQFSTPHGIAVDANGNVYVADRGNNRMQVFDNNLVLRNIYDNIGVSWTVCISPGPHQYLFTSNSNPNGNAPGSWDITGEIYKMELDGTIIGKFGHAGKQLGGFQVVHMMDCRNPDQIIVAEIESWRVQKLMLKPATGAPVRPTTTAAR